MKGDPLPLKWALTFLALTSLCTLIVGGVCIHFYQSYKQERRLDPKFTITQIMQTGPEKGALATDCLAELLSLSSDHPQNLYAFDLKQAKQKLLQCPVIKKASLERLAPSTLVIHYEVRRPVAKLSDYRNTGIDVEGYLFPLYPFFTPKQMPEVYLGLPPFEAIQDAVKRNGGSWNEPMQDPAWILAKQILKNFEKTPWMSGLSIQRIDLSNAFAPTLGRREIVLFTSEEINVERDGHHLSFFFPKILRLPTRDFQNQIQNFFALRMSMQQDYARQLAPFQRGVNFAPRIIDLRLSHLAFVENRHE